LKEQLAMEFTAIRSIQSLHEKTDRREPCNLSNMLRYNNIILTGLNVISMRLGNNDCIKSKRNIRSVVSNF
jgi:hypothetical protein